MKIVIDWDLCQGHANCTGDAPEVFRVDDDGKLHVLIEEPPESMREAVETAARYCPTGAISIRA
ncbi:MAG TPA: ferredoxin [Polyangiales bacterium]